MVLDIQSLGLSILCFCLVFKHLSAPVYVFVAQWDSYQLQELVHSKFPTMRLPPELPSEAEYLGKFGKNTHRSLRRVSTYLVCLGWSKRMKMLGPRWWSNLRDAGINPASKTGHTRGYHSGPEEDTTPAFFCHQPHMFVSCA